MSAAHLIYIPSVLLAGLFFGYQLGARAVREQLRRQQEAQKR